MASKTFNIVFNAIMDASDISANISKIQSALSSLKLPSELQTRFSTIFANLNKEVEAFQAKMAGGLSKTSDVTAFEASGKRIQALFSELAKELTHIPSDVLKKIVDFDATGVKELQTQIKDIKKSLESLNTPQKRLAAIAETIQKMQQGGVQSKALAEFQEAFKSGDYDKAAEALERINAAMQQAQSRGYKTAGAYTEGYPELKSTLDEVTSKLAQVRELEGQIGEKSAGFNVLSSGIKSASSGIKNLNQGVKDYTQSISGAARKQIELGTELDQLKNRVNYFFGLANSVVLFRRALTHAVDTIKELDSAMTETAVVTDYSVGDMWERLPLYTKTANELGATTLGAYQTMTLFYQQGLKTNEAFELGTETMKMARIANLDYTEATDMMTAALRGFNMELNETSAQRVNDVYSQLAAITASDTEEIATAMSKTASIAHSAGMEFETTAAFLAQIVETTRESAETAGTALKTVIARFTELKKAPSEIGEVDGEIVDANKIETALRTAGVALRDMNGEIRATDDVFLELASVWDTLDKNTQRYIATQAAGSRQQSRFLALMSDYERTVELVEEAYNSTGASQKQFDKTLDSLESKLNKLKNAWDAFTMGIMNSSLIKAGVDFLTFVLNSINNITNALPGVGTGLSRIILLFASLKGAKTIFDSFWKGLGAMREAGWVGADAAAAFANGFKVEMGAHGSAISNLIRKIFRSSTEATAANTAASAANATVKATNVGVEGKFATAVNGTSSALAGETAALNASKVAMAGWIAVGVAAAAAMGIFLYKAYDAAIENRTEKAERLSQSISDANENVAEAETATENFISAWDGLQEATDSLDGLVKGTDAWSKKLIEVNQQVIDLLNTYPQLAKYLTISDDGALGLTVDAYDEILEQQRKIIQINQTSALASQVGQIRNDNAVDKSQIAQYLKAGINQAELIQMANKIASESIDITNKAQMRELYNQFGKENETVRVVSGFDVQETVTHDYFEEWYSTIQNSSEALLEFVQSIRTTESEIDSVTSGLVSSIIAQDDALSNSDFVDVLTGLSDNYASQMEGISDQAYDIVAYSTGLMGFLQRTGAAMAGQEDIYGKQYQEALQFYADLTNQTVDKVEKLIKDDELDPQEIVDQYLASGLNDKILEQLNSVNQFLNSISRENQGVVEALLSNEGELFDQAEINQLYSLLGKDFGFEDLGNLTAEQLAEPIMQLAGIETREELDSYLTAMNVSLEDMLNAFRLGAEGIVKVIEDAPEQVKDIDWGKGNFDDLDNSIRKNFAETLSNVDIYGGSVESAVDYINQILASVDDKDVEAVARILSSTNWLDKDQIDYSLDAIKALGYDVSGLANDFYEVADAVRQIDVEKLKTDLSDAYTLIEDLRDRDAEDRGFTEEEYQALLSQGIEGTEFIWTGTEYILRNTTSVEELTAAVQANTSALMEEAKETLDSQVALGEAWNRLFEETKTGQVDYTTEEGMDRTLFVDYNESYIKGLLESQNASTSAEILSVLDLLGEDTTKYEDNTLEQLQTVLTSFYNAFLNYDANLANRAAIDQQQLQAQYYQQGTGQVIQAQPGTSDEDKQAQTDALSALVSSIDGAQAAYDQLISASRAAGTELANNEAVAASLAAQLAETAQDAEKLASTVDDYDDVLQYADKDSYEYLTALEDIADAAEDYFDVSDITTDFVNAHLADFEALAEGGDIAVAAAGRIRAAFLETYQQQLIDVGASASQASELANIVAQMDSLAFDIDGNADFSQIFNALIELLMNIGMTAQEAEARAKEIASAFGFTTSVEQIGVKKQLIGYSQEPGFGFNDYGMKPLYADIPIYRVTASKTDTSFGGIKSTPTSTGKRGSGGGGGGGGGGGSSEEEKYENTYDWLYNLTQDINEELRIREKLQTKFNRLLDDETKSGKDMLDNLNEQINSLRQQAAYQQEMLDKRKQEMRENLDHYSDLSGYATYNWDDMTVEIDWEAIDKVTDKELGERIEKYVSKLEEIESEMDDATDALDDIEDDIKDLKESYRQEYLEFEQRVLDAYVESLQDEIDELSLINDSINDTNANLLSALEDGIEQYRQDRDNQKTENEIEANERKLAYLRQDTSGANALQILELEKTLAEQKEDYTDTLIDQKITELEAQNDFAQQQREEQINLLQAQLDYAQQTGALWGDVESILLDGMGSNGTLVKGSELESLLKSQEGFAGLSNTAKMNWLSTLESDVKAAWVGMQSWNDQIGKSIEAVKQTATSAYSIATSHNSSSSGSSGGGSSGGSSGGSGGGSYSSGVSSTSTTPKSNTYTLSYTTKSGSKKTASGLTLAQVRSSVASMANGGYKKNTLVTIKSSSGKSKTKQYIGGSAYNNNEMIKWVNGLSAFKTGGLADYTGPAWLDGTPAKPELVLNAKDTQNFIELKDILSRSMQSSINPFESGNTYYQIEVHVDSISNDYDMDKAIAKIKQEIKKDSLYRNNTTIGISR